MLEEETSKYEGVESAIRQAAAEARETGAASKIQVCTTGQGERTGRPA